MLWQLSRQLVPYEKQQVFAKKITIDKFVVKTIKRYAYKSNTAIFKIL